MGNTPNEFCAWCPANVVHGCAFQDLHYRPYSWKCPAIAHQFLTHNHWRDGSGIYQHRGVWFHLGGCRFGVSNWFRLFIALTSFKPCSRTCGCCKGCHTDTCKEPWGVKTGITLTPAKNHWVGGSQRASHWHPLRTIGGEGHKGRHTDTHKEPLGVFSR